MFSLFFFFFSAPLLNKGMLTEFYSYKCKRYRNPRDNNDGQYFNVLGRFSYLQWSFNFASFLKKIRPVLLCTNDYFINYMCIFCCARNITTLSLNLCSIIFYFTRKFKNRYNNYIFAIFKQKTK